MKARINLVKAGAGAYQAMSQLENYIRHCGLEMPLIELVKIRVSQINGCAYCLDMHTKDARLAGEAEQRIYVLPAWREAPFYSERERAALEWAETVTLIAGKHVSDEVYNRVKQQFTDEELANLTLVVSTINAWNRFAISFQAEAGTYQPGQRAA